MRLCYLLHDTVQKIVKRHVLSTELIGWTQAASGAAGRANNVGICPCIISNMWQRGKQSVQYNTIQYNTKFVKRHVAVALEALADRTVKKHRRRRTNVL